MYLQFKVLNQNFEEKAYCWPSEKWKSMFDTKKSDRRTTFVYILPPWQMTNKTYWKIIANKMFAITGDKPFSATNFQKFAYL